MTKSDYTEEITLIDLLIVVIRYRRIIIIPLTIAVVVSALVIFIVPTKQYEKNLQNNYSKAVITCRLMKGDYSFIGDQVLSEYILLAFNESEVVLEALKETGITEKKKLNEINYNVYKNKNQKDEYKITFLWDNDLPPDIFVKNLLTAGNKYLKENIVPLAESEIRIYEKLITIEYPRSVIEENIIEIIRRYYAAENFLSGGNELLYFVDWHFVNDNPISIVSLRNIVIKQSVIILIVLFILLVFLVFLINWIDSVRKDQVAMDKLKKAIKRERIN